jgi:CheY-like chemotaxis protein
MRPDVLVSDIGMPGEDGYELIGKVRALPPERGGKVPAVALTAYARRGSTAGAEGGLPDARGQARKVDRTGGHRRESRRVDR